MKFFITLSIFFTQFFLLYANESFQFNKCSHHDFLFLDSDSSETLLKKANQAEINHQHCQAAQFYWELKIRSSSEEQRKTYSFFTLKNFFKSNQYQQVLEHTMTYWYDYCENQTLNTNCEEALFLGVSANTQVALLLGKEKDPFFLNSGLGLVDNVKIFSPIYFFNVYRYSEHTQELQDQFMKLQKLSIEKELTMISFHYTHYRFYSAFIRLNQLLATNNIEKHELFYVVLMHALSINEDFLRFLQGKRLKGQVLQGLDQFIYKHFAPKANPQKIINEISAYRNNPNLTLEEFIEELTSNNTKLKNLINSITKTPMKNSNNNL